jgi:hypothetical protein
VRQISENASSVCGVGAMPSPRSSSSANASSAFGEAWVSSESPLCGVSDVCVSIFVSAGVGDSKR